jgi:hypothetical protein
MHQPALFHDSILDALGSAVIASGGAKKVAALMWPALPPEIATARLRNGLNPEHAQKLCPLEVVRLGRLAKDAGDHSLMNYLAAEWGYSATPVDPEDQSDALRREVRDLLKAANQRLERIERMERITVAK